VPSNHYFATSCERAATTPTASCAKPVLTDADTRPRKRDACSGCEHPGARCSNIESTRERAGVRFHPEQSRSKAASLLGALVSSVILAPKSPTIQTLPRQPDQQAEVGRKSRDLRRAVIYSWLHESFLGRGCSEMFVFIDKGKGRFVGKTVPSLKEELTDAAEETPVEALTD
jgi:hypothetical protein